MKFGDFLGEGKDTLNVFDFNNSKQCDFVELSGEEKSKINKKIQNVLKLLIIVLVIVPLVMSVLSIWFGYTMFLLAGLSIFFIACYYFELKLKLKDKENLVCFKAVCKKRKRGGYRLQYHNFVFNCKKKNGDEYSFTVSSTQKRQFKEGTTYAFLVDLNNIDFSDIERKNIVALVEV